MRRKHILVALILVAITGLGYWIYRSSSVPVLEGSRVCVNDEDCVVFGKTGDCNCGCFNKNYKWKSEGECFCAAPGSCKCVDGVCEGIFEE